MMGEDQRESTFPLDFIKLKSESGSEDIHYSAFYEGTPEEYRLLAQEELNETEENRRNGTKKLRSFADKESLTCTDDDLLLVLRACKYNTKKSEKKLRKFVQIRKQFMKMVADMDLEKFNIIMDDMMFGVLPYRDKHGRVILFSRPNIHLERYDPEEVDVCVFALLFYVINRFPLTSLSGISYIGECKTDNVYNFYPIFNQFRKSYFNFALSAPFRISRIDMVNENVLVRLFANVIRPILPEKITKRLFFHGKGYESLTKVFPPDIMPEDFGGNLGPLNDKFYRERLRNYLQKLKAECKST